MINKIDCWCKPILPLVYEDSLSYYECLCKIRAKVNELTEVSNTLNEKVTNQQNDLVVINSSITELTRVVSSLAQSNQNLAEIVERINNIIELYNEFMSKRFDNYGNFILDGRTDSVSGGKNIIGGDANICEGSNDVVGGNDNLCRGYGNIIGGAGNVGDGDNLIVSGNNNTCVLLDIRHYLRGSGSRFNNYGIPDIYGIPFPDNSKNTRISSLFYINGVFNDGIFDDEGICYIVDESRVSSTPADDKMVAFSKLFNFTSDTVLDIDCYVNLSAIDGFSIKPEYLSPVISWNDDLVFDEVQNATITAGGNTYKGSCYGNYMRVDIETSPCKYVYGYPNGVIITETHEDEPVEITGIGNPLIVGEIKNCTNVGHHNMVTNSNQHLIGGHLICGENAHSSVVVGSYNGDVTPTYFMVGTGSSADRVTSLSVDRNTVYGKTYSTNGADFAEYFEWNDGNPENKDRRGLFVSLDTNGKIIVGGDKPIGVVSSNPSIVGNSCHSEWHGKYLKDKFGCYIYEDIVIDGEVEKVRVISPDYKPEEEYVGRDKRAEWCCVALLGQVSVIDNGHCSVGGWCKPDTKTGCAVHTTDSVNGYRVIGRIADDVITVLIK